MGMGGIGAYYPTRVEFHYPSPVPAGGPRHVRRGRQGSARPRHPRRRPLRFQQDAEGRFRRPSGVVLPQGGRQPGHLQRPLFHLHQRRLLSRAGDEDSQPKALERYDVDGLFFNMFGNQSTRLQRRVRGPVPLRCLPRQVSASCTHARSRNAPTTTTASSCSPASREVAAAIGKLIREKRPHAGYFNYMQEYTDGIMSESNTAVRRPLPLWPYSASDNVNRARNSQPGKTAGESEHAVRGFLVALCDRPAPGDCAAHVAEHGQRRRARPSK